MSFKKIVFSVIKFSHRQLFYKKNITLFYIFNLSRFGHFFSTFLGTQNFAPAENSLFAKLVLQNLLQMLIQNLQGILSSEM